MNRQRGYTLVELLIVIAITGIIVPFLGIAIYQMVTVTELGNDELIASQELQNAAQWFRSDGSRASDATPGTAEIAFSFPAAASITYTLIDTELVRQIGSEQITLARNIENVVFSINNRLVTMELTSAPEGRSNVTKTGTYQVYMRVAP